MGVIYEPILPKWNQRKYRIEPELRRFDVKNLEKHCFGESRHRIVICHTFGAEAGKYDNGIGKSYAVFSHKNELCTLQENRIMMNLSIKKS